jgi:hypothetical protein
MLDCSAPNRDGDIAWRSESCHQIEKKPGERGTDVVSRAGIRVGAGYVLPRYFFKSKRVRCRRNRRTVSWFCSL